MVACMLTDGATLIHRLANHVHDASQGTTAHRHLQPTTRQQRFLCELAATAAHPGTSVAAATTMHAKHTPEDIQ